MAIRWWLKIATEYERNCSWVEVNKRLLFWIQCTMREPCLRYRMLIMALLLSVDEKSQKYFHILLFFIFCVRLSLYFFFYCHKTAVESQLMKLKTTFFFCCHSDHYCCLTESDDIPLHNWRMHRDLAPIYNRREDSMDEQKKTNTKIMYLRRWHAEVAGV